MWQTGGNPLLPLHKQDVQSSASFKASSLWLPMLAVFLSLFS
jgi:hypothetical protein